MPRLDIHGNGQAGALTEGLLMIRCMCGVRGDTLIQGAVGPGAIQTTSTQIEKYLRPFFSNMA